MMVLKLLLQLANIDVHTTAGLHMLDHLKLLYIERLTASSFLFFSFTCCSLSLWTSRSGWNPDHWNQGRPLLQTAHTCKYTWQY